MNYEMVRETESGVDMDWIHGSSHSLVYMFKSRSEGPLTHRDLTVCN